jgi:hypothetical protein
MQDKAIMQRTHGIAQVPGVQHTQPDAKGNKRNARGGKVKVFHELDQSAVAVLHSQRQGSIAAGKPMGGPGNNQGIPLSKQKFCEYCHKWVVDFPQHVRTGINHAKNEATGIKWFWCDPCSSSFLVTATHVCVAPPTKVPGPPG